MKWITGYLRMCKDEELRKIQLKVNDLSRFEFGKRTPRQKRMFFFV